MTGGIAVVLGSTGCNFGAGMSGGVAYVYDPEKKLEDNCNMDMIELFKLNEKGNDSVLKEILEKHVKFTGSEKAKSLLNNWKKEQEYRHINEIMAECAKKGTPKDQLEQKAFDIITASK